MGYRGADLTVIFPQAPAKHAAHRMAEDVGKALLNAARVHTPVDTGQLRASWELSKVKPEVHAGTNLPAHVISFYTEKEYAPYVEHGTGKWGPSHQPYPIRPKTPGGVLHFMSKDGHEVFTKLVMHPGSRGHHMVQHAMSDVESIIHLICEPAILEWRNTMNLVLQAEAAKARARVRLP